MVRRKNDYRAHPGMTNTSSGNFLLITPIRNWHAFFTSPEVIIVRESLPNRWTQNQISSLHSEGWAAPAIHDDLAATFGEEAMAYNKVTSYLCEARLNPADAT
jgi:hypothetical protein